MDFSNEKENVIYLAGGCFWGMEHLMQSIRGVTKTTVGYANGSGQEEADYKTVCKGHTGFRETVRVKWNPEKVSLEAILMAYFYVVDPTVQNQQGEDVGTQYQTGIYYTNDRVKETAERIAAIEKEGEKEFHVEILPLINFYPAEEYHQDYLNKNPHGYCHIPFSAMKLFSSLDIKAEDYTRPAREVAAEKTKKE